MLQVPPSQVSNRGRLDRVEQFKQLNNSIDSIEERKNIIKDVSNSEFNISSLRVNIESPKQVRWQSVLKIANLRKRSKSMGSNILNKNTINDWEVVESKYYLQREELIKYLIKLLSLLFKNLNHKGLLSKSLYSIQETSWILEFKN